MDGLFEYTSDKWQWIYNDILEGDTVFDDDLNQIAIVCPYDERNKIGRLIAAAPEMYELLSVCYVIVPKYYEKKIEKLLSRIDGEEE